MFSYVLNVVHKNIGIGQIQIMIRNIMVVVFLLQCQQVALKASACLTQSTHLTKDYIAILCATNTDFTFQFVKEETNETRPIGECKLHLNVQSCYLIKANVKSDIYDVQRTEHGGRLLIYNTTQDSFGKYFCASKDIKIGATTDASETTVWQTTDIPTKPVKEVEGSPVYTNLPSGQLNAVCVMCALLCLGVGYLVANDFVWKWQNDKGLNIVAAKAHLTLWKSKGQGSIPIASLEQKKDNTDETRQLLSGTQIHDPSQSNEGDSWEDAACGSKLSSNFRTDTGRTFTVEDGVSDTQKEVNPSLTVELEMPNNDGMDSAEC